MDYVTIEVPTKRTELDKEIAMYLIRVAMDAMGREKHLASVAAMRELARQFPTADIAEVGAKWQEYILKLLARQEFMQTVAR